MPGGGKNPFCAESNATRSGAVARHLREVVQRHLVPALFYLFASTLFWNSLPDFFWNSLSFNSIFIFLRYGGSKHPFGNKNPQLATPPPCVYIGDTPTFPA